MVRQDWSAQLWPRLTVLALTPAVVPGSDLPVVWHPASARTTRTVLMYLRIGDSLVEIQPTVPESTFMTTRILCVCLGNICRSPMAEGAIRAKAAAAGKAVDVDSAGTGAWHIGNPPDKRGLEAAAARGYDNSGQRARQVGFRDFFEFDLLLAMDRNNLSDLRAARPADARCEIRLFDPAGREIPDPYYGGPEDYELALDMVEDAAADLIRHL